MARLNLATRKMRKREKLSSLLLLWLEILNIVELLFQFICHLTKYRVRNYFVRRSYSMNQYVNLRSNYLNDLVHISDKRCIDHLRMDMCTFAKLCAMLRTIGKLEDYKYVSLEEQVALFFNILAHHKKNCVVHDDFKRSGCTISHYFNNVLNGVLRLHGVLLKTPEPVEENSKNERWKWFQNCIEALDGTYIKVRVPLEDKSKYRNRKGKIATNVLVMCSQDLQFIYVLSGWEGSAVDGRVLRDAMSRSNGLRVPRGFTNCDGFLAPFRGQ